MSVLRFRSSPAGLAVVALGGFALFGWGAFGVTAAGQRSLETRLAQAESDRDTLQAWQKQFRDVETELREMQAKVGATRDELAQVTATREKAKAQLAATQRDLTAITKRLDQAREKATQTTGSLPAADPAKKPAR
ncbi:hypothetical protein [Methylobacterium sp. ID0610]|uniref:hypothetical protein n=1 Tax=Methylobacterium carpenticola TaxID=3344827 RepID=UPI003686FD84